jgi:hypothetical protein
MTVLPCDGKVLMHCRLNISCCRQFFQYGELSGNNSTTVVFWESMCGQSLLGSITEQRDPAKVCLGMHLPAEGSVAQHLSKLWTKITIKPSLSLGRAVHWNIESNRKALEEIKSDTI